MEKFAKLKTGKPTAASRQKQLAVRIWKRNYFLGRIMAALEKSFQHRHCPQQSQ